MKRLILLSLVIMAGAVPADSQQVLKPQFSHPGIIRYDHDAFIIHGKDTFIFSGSFHYFRSYPTQWMSILRKMKAAGFNTVQTYVPWNFHEKVEGKVNFTLLNRFLDDCKRMGFYVTIRVGPYVCGEWDEGGFPHWLAGKGIGFRTDSPQDLYWSKYWYNEVLPVIRKHLITNGGSVILVQIENEYNYFGLPPEQKVRYLKSLYRDVIANHIDVPVITCWTQQARDNTDSIFSQIMDAGDFYPGWHVAATLPRIRLLKEQQPFSPPFITELQGGWFSAIGDKTVRHIHEYGAGQINALTKYVIAHGIKGFNYYVLYGGTNFGYSAGKWKITSYDYTAPISECGGLWAKYYTVKLIGDFIKYAQPYLSLCHEVPNGVSSPDSGISTMLRSDGGTGFLYVYNETDRARNAKIEVKMPGRSPFDFRVPMEPRNACLLPVDFPIEGGRLFHYTNVQLSAVTKYDGRPLLVAYGNPGEQAVVDYGSKIFREPVTSGDHLYSWNGAYILLTSSARAARAVNFETDSGPAVMLSNSYLAVAGKHSGSQSIVRLQTRPGEDTFSLVMTGGLKSIRMDGRNIPYTTNPGSRMIQFGINTPSFKTPQVKFGRIRYTFDRLGERNSYFKHVPAPHDGVYPSLDSMRDYRNGYSVYRAKLELPGRHMLEVGYYTDDWHSVFIDGKPVKGLTGSKFRDLADVDLTGGMHTVRIVYENEARPNSGYMEEKKGLRFIHVLGPRQVRVLRSWKYFVQETAPPAEEPSEADTDYNDSRWRSVAVGSGSPGPVNREQAGSWYRRTLELTAIEARETPRLVFGGISRSATIYVNGKDVYSFRHHGWNNPFTVPLNGIARPGRNFLAIYVENREGKGGIVAPIEFEYGTAKPLKLTGLVFHAFLNGGPAGWEKPGYSAAGWKTAGSWDTTVPGPGVRWYRSSFTVPTYKGWVVPWRIHIESTGNLQIWLNGKMLGRYYARGPQKNFFMPDGWLHPGKKNTLVLVMRPSGNGGVDPVLKDISVTPYSQYVVRKNTLVIKN